MDKEKKLNGGRDKSKDSPRTGLEESFVLYDHKKLRMGYTTGSCAAAAAKAGTRTLLTGVETEEIVLDTPKGIRLHLPVEDIHIQRDESGIPVKVCCAVRKDGGDDIDATNGALIYAEVSCTGEAGVTIDGGEGVGRVTKPGLDQPVGNAAINHVPREMITKGVLEVCREQGYTGGISVIIRIPEGQRIAEKTFNPRLGIVGGISVLGTSGIVMPMSEKALIDTIRVEMKMRRENGGEYLVITPGNFGEKFASEMPDLVRTHEMKCSNFVGETLDMAVDLGVKGILFISHIGKFIKVSGGIMNTHSHEADCRAELIAAAVLRAGGGADLAREVLSTNTTEDALKILKQEGGDGLFDAAMKRITERIGFYLNARVQGRIETGAVIFSNVFGMLGGTENVPDLVEKLRRQG
ncbi:cobalt-precorrin-5B (C(1))-methyltransferase CbiD [Bilifractor sp. LCP19S3_H10]|uniref:cobalt-precorrin-5B (C(1))-methyltransferase CbiD n=1 Tax=Bilifractor sp. LCP19S3_H10 TaxID=3438736 RepID=UPI003F910D7A